MGGGGGDGWGGGAKKKKNPNCVMLVGSEEQLTHLQHNLEDKVNEVV